MKRLALAVLALALAPVAGLAQTTPPPGPPPGGPDAMGSPNPARFALMQQVRQQMTALRRQSRAQMLASLTPQHRQQLATLIGSYAISADPSPDGLARQVDALLSKNELQSVVNIAASERTNARGMMEAARTQMESTLTADQRATMAAREQKRAAFGAGRQPRTPDPGRELVRSLLGGEHEGGPHGGPGMGMDGRPPM